MGFQTEVEAQKAIDYCNRSYIDVFRIEVEIARPYGDSIIPRPWSKYSNGSSSNQKRKFSDDESEVHGKAETDQESGLSQMLGMCI